MKKIIALAVSTPLALLAEGEPSQSMDVSKAVGMVDAAEKGLTSLLEAVQPYITFLVLSVLGLWAGYKLIKFVVRAFYRTA